MNAYGNSRPRRCLSVIKELSLTESKCKQEEIESQCKSTTEKVNVGCWNIHGLTDYKQKNLLLLMCQLGLEVLAITETHLVQQEQHVQWDQAREVHAGFSWYGRPAKWISGSERGRGSGGVGLLIRRDWCSYVTTLPACEHDCSLFIRLWLPNSPKPLYIGVAYVVPVGTARYDRVAAQLEELGERVSQYQQLGAVILMGDFNVHIGCHPSTVSSRCRQENSNQGMPLFDSGFDASELTSMSRKSIDTIGVFERWDGTQRAGHPGVLFVERMDTNGMVILNGLEAIGDGQIAEATLGNQSVIDFIMVDSDSLKQMDSVRVDYSAVDEIPSDHHLVRSSYRYVAVSSGAPLSQPLVVNGGVKDEASLLINLSRYKIDDKGEESHWRLFEVECKRRLLPLSRQWRDIARATEEPVSIETAWNAFTDETHAAAALTLGKRNASRDGRSQHPVRPGREDSVVIRKLKKERRKLLQLKRLNSSVRVDERYKLISGQLRNHQRRAIHHGQIKTMRRIQSLKPDQMRQHWVELKRMGNLQAVAPAVPSVALAADESDRATVTVTVSEPAAVRSVWYKAWSRLAEHDRANRSFNKEFHDEVTDAMGTFELESDSQGLADLEADESKRPEDESLGVPWRQGWRVRCASAKTLNTPITPAEVSISVRHLQRGKAVGSDGITAEVLKYGGEGMHECLHSLCQLVFNQGEAPMDWLRGVIVPLHKGGDEKQPLNYRPITLLSVAGKVYTGILQQRLMKWSEANHIIEPEQGGFRPKRGCPEQVFTLTELIKLRRLQGRRTYACFIDIKKAYDTVWHDGLKTKLMQAGIHGTMYRAICSLYAACESTIQLGSQLGYTDFFPIEAGVRQGCILSPWLYSLFINDLARLLKAQPGCGVEVRPGYRLCVLLYADDIVLLSENEDDLSELMDTVHEYSVHWRFEVNHSKCGLMRFVPSGAAQLPSSILMIGDTAVPWVAQYKYLGIELHAGVPFKMFKKRMLISAARAGNAVSGLGMYSGKLPVPLGDQVYKALVRPLLEYCSEVWSIQPWVGAESVQIKMGKRILACPLQTSSEAVRGELGWHCMEARYQQARVVFWGKLQLMEPSNPARVIFEASQLFYAQSAAGDARVPDVPAEEGWAVTYAPPSAMGLTLWCAQLKGDLFQLGLSSFFNNPSSLLYRGLDQWKLRIQRAVAVRESARWWRAVTESAILQTYRLLRPDPKKLQREMYLSISHDRWKDRRLNGRRILTRLRCGCNELRIHTGRWAGIPRDSRLCELCGEDVETETHFLLHCTFFRDQRATFWDKIDSVAHSHLHVGGVAAGLGLLGLGLAGGAADPISSFRMNDISPAEQMCLLTGGGNAQLKEKQVQKAIMGCVLIELSEWMAERKAHLELAAAAAAQGLA